MASQRALKGQDSPQKRPTSGSRRRKSHTAFSENLNHRWEVQFRKVFLDVDHLVLLLEEMIPALCSDTELVGVAKTMSQQLVGDQFDISARSNSSRKSQPDDTNVADEVLENVAIILEDFIGGSTVELPPVVLSFVHTQIGLIRQRQGQYNFALVSLLKSLWIRKQASHDICEQVGLACHRLGLIYGQICDYEQACLLLKQALHLYQGHQQLIGKNHDFILGATQSLEVFQMKADGCGRIHHEVSLPECQWILNAEEAVASLLPR